ncbi:MAG: type II secretion system F family protein [Thermoleophilia bacterium]
MSGPVAVIVAGLSAALMVAGVGRVAAERSGAAVAAARGRTARPAPVARTAWGARLGGRLARAGLPIGPDAFVAATAAAALIAGVGVQTVLGLPLATVAAVAAVGAGAAAVVRSADARHLARMTDQLPGVTQQLAAGLQAGLSLRQALARAARDAPSPVRVELGRVVAELELGTRVDDALAALVRRVPAHDLRVIVTAILVQRRTGGNLARALSALSVRLDERTQLARELRGATAQARMTAWLVAVLPLGGGAMAEVASPGTLQRTLGQGVGPLLLGAAAVLYGAGVLWIRRIGRVEP